MADDATQAFYFERGFSLAREILAAESDAAAHDRILLLVKDLVAGSRAYLYALDAAGAPSLARFTTLEPPTRSDESRIREAVTDALDRHEKKVELAACPGADISELETDETLPLRLVAKVLAVDEKPLGVAVIWRDEGDEFGHLERRLFSSLCLNASSGLARRRPRRAPVVASTRPPGGDEPRGRVAEGVVKVKTARLKVKPDHFSQPLYGLIGRSAAMRNVRELIHRYGPADEFPVLILGETGTGKELVARAIHDESPRRKKPYRPLNAAGLTPTLADNELFGHERGAFTGADRASIGLFRAASGGSLFFDEFGDLPLPTQAALLRTLETKAIRPVGDTEEIPVDVRIIAATNQNLPTLVEQGKFRDELLQRVNVLDLTIPPLRERREDIPLLAEAFLASLAPRFGAHRFSPRAVEAMTQAPWPGNVRDLRHSIERAVVVAGRREVLEPEDLRLGAQPAGPDLAPIDARKRELFTEALVKHGGVQTRAALELKVSRNTLRKEIARLGITIPTRD